MGKISAEQAKQIALRHAGYGTGDTDMTRRVEEGGTGDGGYPPLSDLTRTQHCNECWIIDVQPRSDATQYILDGPYALVYWIDRHTGNVVQTGMRVCN